MKVAKIKVYVAMSGGVDSSVAAALLKKQGHNVTGVFFKPWAPPASNYCNWEQDRRDAMRVASKIGIEFKTWDFSKEYEKEVVSYMINSYRTGTTPNPDVMCNKEIKFGLFLKKALAEGADYIATGHYIRKTERSKSHTADYVLRTAKDQNKDQSYFLWTLTQKRLKYCLFPIGDYTKPEVRKLAKKFGLPNHNKKDSQGVCFVGQLDMKEFLKNYIKPKPGNIILSETGKILGQHDSVFYYTIGQRHGLDIKDGQGPYFVVSKNIKKNIIYVAKQTGDKELLSKNTRVTKLSWVTDKPKLPAKVFVKIRYRSKSLPATITADGKGLTVSFKNPAKAVTPGQSAVFYRGQEALGGGIIK
ncbi:MAG: tRNA 2-thiouridine(34) synthase MnmA [Candidatus Yanofskybacteria bacterium]|nr:tRNA 2-thiouridine(34) synthase MnmA [Candidatus Yanofskybacteria bacterium]